MMWGLRAVRHRSLPRREPELIPLLEDVGILLEDSILQRLGPENGVLLAKNLMKDCCLMGIVHRVDLFG
jgi:hypothetical protein